MDKETLLSMDIHISEFDVPETSSFCGKRLRELNIRQQAGVNVVSIVRGNINILIPGGERHVYPHDRLVVAGNDQDMDRFSKLIESSVMPQNKTNASISLENIFIHEGSPLIGKSIMESGIREQASCIVMGIIRPNQGAFMNPDPAMTFQAEDYAIVAGAKSKIELFKEQHNK